MKHQFDVVVVGSGSAARAAAYPLNSAGRTVAMIDSRPFGGTCALRGCDPKKVLVGAAEGIDHVRRMRGKGVLGDSTIAWPELIAFKRTFTDSFPDQMLQRLTAGGIAAIRGTARFVSPNSLRVGDDTLQFANCVIASGAKPQPLNIPGQDLAITSDEFLELEMLPKRLLFIGGGYIAFEFAHVAARSGAAVTIVHRGTRPLENFDADLVARLLARTRDLGIEVQVEASVTGIRQMGYEFVVSTEVAGTKQELSAELVVHAAGRIPTIDELDLAAANVAFDERGVSVNEYLQSKTNAAIYAAGDVSASGAPPLSPIAGYEGSIVAHNLLHEKKRKTEVSLVPTVAFTIPPLASVGIKEDEARRDGLDVEIKLTDTSGWYSSRRTGESHSGAKILIDRRTDKILGVHLLAPSADETINLFALAMRAGIRAADLKATFFAYPTAASDIHYLL